MTKPYNLYILKNPSFMKLFMGIEFKIECQCSVCNKINQDLEEEINESWILDINKGM